jgi:site-specific recombinase XerC
VRITAVRKLAVEAADNGLLAPELAAGITRVKGPKSKGVRLGNWLSLRQAQALLNAPDTTTKKGLRDRAMLTILLGCGLRRFGGRGAYARAYPATRQPLVHHRSRGKARARAHDSDADVG